MDLIRSFLSRMKRGAAEASPAATAPSVETITLPEIETVPSPVSTPLDFQPLDPAFVNDPYPMLARLRDEDPVHRNSSAIWALSRHADIVAAMGDSRFGNAPSPYAVVNSRNKHRYVCADVANNIIPFLDPPEHDTPRRLIGRAFAKQIRHNPPDMKVLAEEFISPLRSRAEFDLLHDFATPYSISVMGRALGVPSEDEAMLKEWSHWFFYLFSLIPSHEVREKLDLALAAFRDYFKQRLEAVKRSPDGTLLAGLAESGLSDPEIVDTCMLLFADGVENVDRAIASGTSVMLGKPGLWQHLGSNPEAIPAAVDECLRFESPAMFVGRVAREDIPLHGKIIPKNAGVLLLLGSANRDHEVFPDAHEFLPDRAGNRHLAFGQGRHSCIGGPMVRLEMITAFEVLTREFPNLQMTKDAVEWTPRIGHRWPSGLPVRVG